VPTQRPAQLDLLLHLVLLLVLLLPRVLCPHPPAAATVALALADLPRPLAWASRQDL
jgi:hypothetical protein